MSEIQQRFDKYTIPEPNSGCLLWFGSVDRNGYGQLRLGKHDLRFASHIALELDGRPVPAGQCALHKCDNPACVNAAHLFIGTQIDNIDDMNRKGRGNQEGLALGRLDRISPLIKQQARQLFEAGRTATEIGSAVGLAGAVVHRWMKQWGHRAIPQSERTHCPHGHAYAGGNLYIAPRGDRQCRACMRLRDKQRKSRARNALS